MHEKTIDERKLDDDVGEKLKDKEEIIVEELNVPTDFADFNDVQVKTNENEEPFLERKEEEVKSKK